ncbi:MAG: hypothetical protein Q8P07_00220 [bacterium]|nr:hypothetical protein [bacterium]
MKEEKNALFFGVFLYGHRGLKLRGITEQQKKALVRRFLYARRKKKLPTQNAT